MDERIAGLESQIASLAKHVVELEYRLDAIEAGRSPMPERRPAADSGVLVDIAPAVSDTPPLQQWLAVAGRTLVVLGGAYLLRALTAAHIVPAPVGVALGLAYGAPWLVLASRAGPRGRQLDSSAHALAAALIGYPLVWEATIRFGVLQPAQSAALLGGLTAAALLLAAVVRLEGLAWVVTFGAIGFSAALAIATAAWTPYTAVAVVVGLLTLWGGYAREWRGLCWVGAAGANLMIVLTTSAVAEPGAVRQAVALQWLLFAGYAGGVAIRTHRMTAFEIAQTAVATALALGGSLVLLGKGSSALRVTVALLGVITYAFAFGFVRSRRDGRTFAFWASYSLVMAIIAVAACLTATVASLVLAMAALALTITARRAGASATVGLQASAYTVAAAAVSGVFGAAWNATVASSASFMLVDAPMALAFLALACAVLAPPTSSVFVRSAVTRLPRFILVAAFLWASIAAAVSLLSSAAGNGRSLDPAVFSTMLTAVMVAAILVLARVQRYDSGREAGWLVAPLLVITGLKLLVIDFPGGRPQTLFGALALYGVALIVAPRLSRGSFPPQR